MRDLLSLRSTIISRGQFRAGLKTYLFNLAFYTDSFWELLLKSVLTYLLTYFLASITMP